VDLAEQVERADAAEIAVGVTGEHREIEAVDVEADDAVREREIEEQPVDVGLVVGAVAVARDVVDDASARPIFDANPTRRRPPRCAASRDRRPGRAPRRSGTSRSTRRSAQRSCRGRA
jgi:hypothetical protein